MYTDAFGLTDDPFRISPSLRFAYRGAEFQAALSTLRSGLRSGRSPALVIGEGGLGKTSLLKALAEDLGGGDPPLPALLESCSSWSMAESLIAAAPKGDAGSVLLLDEAHLLPSEQIGPLVAEAGAKNVLLVLAGGPALAEQVEGKLAVRLEPLGPTDIASYVGARMKAAGGTDGKAFSDEALSRLATASGGVPRRINRLCSTAMFIAATAGRGQVTEADIAEAIATLGFEAVAPVSQPRAAPTRPAPTPPRPAPPPIVLRAEPLLPRTKPPARMAARGKSRMLGAAAAIGAEATAGLVAFALIPQASLAPVENASPVAARPAPLAEIAPSPAESPSIVAEVAPPVGEAAAVQTVHSEAKPAVDPSPPVAEEPPSWTAEIDPPAALAQPAAKATPKEQPSRSMPPPVDARPRATEALAQANERPPSPPAAAKPARIASHATAEPSQFEQAGQLARAAADAEARGDWIAAVEQLDAARALDADHPDVVALEEARRRVAAAVRPAETAGAPAAQTRPTAPAVASRAPQALLARPSAAPPSPQPARPVAGPLDARLLDSAEEVGQALARGADPNSRYDNDHRPLTIAARDRRPDLIAVLLRHGADPNAQTRDSATPLMYAAWNGDLVSATFLLQGGASVDPVNLDGKTPLMAAATRGHAAMVELLLRNGADVDAQNLRGWTALMYAAWGGHRQAADLLLRSGANAALANRQGNTAAELAEMGRRPAIARSMAVPTPVN